MEIADILSLVLLIGLLNASILITLLKFDILENYEARFGHYRFLPRGDCFFCLGFWIAVLQAICFAIVSPGFEWIIFPFCSTAVSTYISHAIIKITD